MDLFLLLSGGVLILASLIVVSLAVMSLVECDRDSRIIALWVLAFVLLNITTLVVSVGSANERVDAQMEADRNAKAGSDAAVDKAKFDTRVEKAIKEREGK